jgi:hypothetical protein
LKKAAKKMPARQQVTKREAVKRAARKGAGA